MTNVNTIASYHVCEIDLPMLHFLGVINRHGFWIKCQLIATSRRKQKLQADKYGGARFYIYTICRPLVYINFL